MARIDRKIQIMKVVEGLATDRRFHEITLDEVAAAAGVGKGTIYRYFSDKDELFFQVATSGFDELCELLEQIVPADHGFPEKLSTICQQIGRFFATRRQLLQMMQNEAGRIFWAKGRIRERWMAKREKLFAAVGEVLDEGVRAKIVRSDVSTEVLATFLLGMLRTMARDLYNADDPEEQYKLLLELFLRGAGRLNGEITGKGDL
ncbi:MAG: TetR/AcrR family transcriptional regulator [Planctomycetes bacterium]|nr:TetR/AcrR family transcriptional regulator [Planctomycetota bacterium]